MNSYSPCFNFLLKLRKTIYKIDSSYKYILAINDEILKFSKIGTEVKLHKFIINNCFCLRASPLLLLKNIKEHLIKK